MKRSFSSFYCYLQCYLFFYQNRKRVSLTLKTLFQQSEKVRFNSKKVSFCFQFFVTEFLFQQGRKLRLFSFLTLKRLPESTFLCFYCFLHLLKLPFLGFLTLKTASESNFFAFPRSFLY